MKKPNFYIFAGINGAGKTTLDFVDNAFIFDNTNGFKKIAIKQNDKLHILEKMKWFH